MKICQFLPGPVLLSVFSLVIPLASAQNHAATFGSVIQLGGTPSDLVLDESRHLIYLVNAPANRIDLFNTGTNGIVGNIPVGTTPLAAAMSMDNAFLYVTNNGNSTLSVIDLTAQRVMQTVSLPSAPQGVEVGTDGTALISVGTTGTTNTLLVFDRTQTGANALTTVVQPPPPSTPSPLPAQTLARPDTTFFSKLIRTPNGQYIVGLTNPTTTTTYLFVYEVSSHTILRSRTVTGQSTVLAISPDGARIMAGYTMYDVATLSILGQLNNANAPFSFPASFNNRQNIGGSVFSPDGKTLYGAFNVTAFANPAPVPNASTLLLTSASNLAINLGIRLPESIVAKMVITADGANAWSLSQSGLLYLPLSTLYTYPILTPSTTQVFLSQNPCNPGLVQGTVQIGNAGAGKLTFAVNTISPTLTSSVNTGVAPSTITFTMEPGRLTTYTRQAGTNLVNGAATLVGQALDVTLASNEAINLPPIVRVYMNFRNSDQRGVIFPIPVTPNNAVATTQVAGDQGLEDIVLDQPRNRVYITNAGYNRIEVFDTVGQTFLTPIPVGQLPHQMAMSTDGNTLYVGNTGGELIDTIDLTINQDVGHINFPPIPRQAAGATAVLQYPQALAVGLAGLEFVMANGNVGTQWMVVGGNAVPRPPDLITKNGTTAAATNTFTTPVNMLASPDNTRILTLAGNGNAYLYDGAADAYIQSAALFSTNPQGFYGPLSAGPAQSWYAFGGLWTNSALTILGGTANPSTRNVVATAPYDASNFIRLSTPIRGSITAIPVTDPRPTLEMVNVSTGTVTQLAVAPENPRYTLFGTTRFNIPARSMVIDSNNVAYVITISGLSVVPLTPNGAPTPAITAAGTAATLKIGGVININGSNLASSATANVLPPPTVLGGSCVTFNDVALPLLQTSSGQIQAQIPTNVTPGSNVVQVRSLATGMQSAPVVVSVQSPAGSPGTNNTGNTSVDQGRVNNRISPK